MIVVWQINEHCNLTCPFCAFDASLRRPRRQADAAEVERFAGLLAEHGRAAGAPTLISWIGGEPLLWAPMFTLGQRLRSRHDLRLSATTNGSSLDRATVRQQILDGLDELTVSVDGPPQVHDSLRRAPGNWKKIAKGISDLSRRCRSDATTLRKLRANVVLMRANLEHFTECCRLLADLGIDEITFNALGGRDRPEYFPAQRLRPSDVAQIEELLPSLRSELAPRGVRLCGRSTYLERLRDGALDRAVSAQGCRPGHDFLFVDTAGRVAPCHFTSAELGIPIESIANIEDVQHLRDSFACRSQKHRPSACTMCPSTHVFAKFAG